MENYRVIFHIDDGQKWPAVLNNVRNLLKDWADGENQLEIEVLANGSAVRNLKRTGEAVFDADRLKGLAEEGVQFVACNNSLKANKIAVEEVYDFIEVVPAGVSELVKKQHAGFAYIKP